MRYLITGGAGFIGSHVADRLVGRGDTVSLLDDLSTGSTANIQHLLSGPSSAAVRFTEGSVLDHSLVSQLTREVDVIVHLAATVGVELVVKKPLETLLNNVRGTEIVLDVAVQRGTKVLVTSTSEIYGKNAAGALHEESDRILGSLLKARWAYATSKEVDEIFAFEYWRQRKLPTVVARLFNCVGPRQTGAYGMVVPRFVRQALTGEDLTVFGDGTQSRCFCHVMDAVGGLVALLDCDEAIGDVFNVGSQNEISVRSLAELLIEMTASSSSIRYVPYSEAYEPGFEDMERRLPDISKITGLTGWVPRQGLKEILEDVIEYERRPLAGAEAADV
ncbi:MAG: NAD-dependent epimerase/dehydratase family protein [Chloroflexi bacterium]|nr:MAG: NAD-dependent epimerase/dehydratase family protein [Chloroflexota bacterium]